MQNIALSAAHNSWCERFVLCVAAERRQPKLITFLLECIYYFHGNGKDVCTRLLLEPTYTMLFEEDFTVFSGIIESLAQLIAWTPEGQRGTEIEPAAALLRFEKQYLSDDGKVQQWSYPMDIRKETMTHSSGGYMPKYHALTHAVMHFEEDTLCQLLQIAVPSATDEPDPSGQTALYLAAKNNRLKVTRALVEHCQANINKKVKGETALAAARSRGHEAIVGYLESRT